MSDAAPQEVIQAWGDLPFLRQVKSNEWHAACPNCGTAGHSETSGMPDRFFIVTEGTDPERTRGICRRCGYAAFAMNEVRKTNRVRLGPEQLEQMRVQREFEEKRKLAEIEARRREFESSRLWDKYHDSMVDQDRRWWERQGIPKEWQDYWRLGATPSLWDLGPAFTIPFFHRAPGDGHQGDGAPVTLQYRLLEVKGNDKYRFERGLGVSYFVARPDMDIAGQVVYVVEGAKKAMVTHILGTGGKIQVIGFPNKQSDGGAIPILKKASLVHLILDPDAWDVPANSPDNYVQWPIRYALQIGKHVKVARLPGKIDDILLAGDLDCSGLESALRYSRSYP